MSESILILGAGLMQSPAILSAKNLGLKTFVIDANPNAPAASAADCFKKIDLKDRDGIARYALQLKETENLKAVFTAGTDFSANVAYAAEKCGLPSHSYEGAVNASDKALMRQCFRNARVPSPHFIKIERKSLDKIVTENVAANLKYPFVIKPVDNMGARGCRMVRKKSELIPALKDAFNYSRSETAIMEEYIEGPEYSIDALIYNGTLTITGFAARHIYYPPYFIEMGHTMPAQLPYERYIVLIKTFAYGIKSLGLSHGAAKADIKFSPTGPMVGEIAARLSGGYMSGWTFPYSSNLNLTEQAILIALGRTPEALEAGRFPLSISEPYEIYSYISPKASAERAWISIPGKVKKVLNLKEAGKIQNVRDVLPRVKKGDEVCFPKSNVEKCGNVIAVSESRAQAIAAAEKAVASITIVLEKDNPETEKFLQESNLKSAYPPSAFVLGDDVGRKFMHELDCNSNKRITRDSGAKNNIPESLAGCMELRDWNHISLRETIEKFDKMELNYTELDYKKFWVAMIRGGIQGALYVAS